MDLGEKDDMCDYEKIHRLIENTYKNILKNYNPGVKQLIVLGKALQKTIQNVGTSFKAYNECLYELARSAEACLGSTKELGLGLLQLTDIQNEMNQHLHDSIKVSHAELLIPLKAKQENEFRHVQALFDKYITGHKYHSNNLRRAQNLLEKCKKKSKSKSGQKEIERTRQWKECKNKLEEYLRKNLRLALLEERKRYCYLFNRLLCVVEDKVNKTNKTNERLMEGLRTWPELVRSPHILPSSTEQIIHDFGFSDDSCDVEDEPSGDVEHGDARRGTSASLNPRDLQRNPPPAHDWRAKRAASAGARDMDMKYSATLSTTTPHYDSAAIIVTSETPEAKRFHPTPGILCAVYPYVAATETQLSLDTNDIIRIYGDVQNGWVYGRNTRTNKEGWFPLSFTDFTEEAMQWNTSQFGHFHTMPQNTNLRNTWHPEISYSGSTKRVETESGDASTDADTTRSPPNTIVSSTRPASFCTSAATTEINDQNAIRYKYANRRILSLEPITEQIPPPVEFRDHVEQINIRTTSGQTLTGTDRPKSTSPSPRPSSRTECAQEAGNQTSREYASRASAEGCDQVGHCTIVTENQACMLEPQDRGVQGRGSPRTTSGLPLVQVQVEESGPMAFPPPPPPKPLSPPAPPSAAGCVSFKPPRQSFPIYAVPSPVYRSGVKQTFVVSDDVNGDTASGPHQLDPSDPPLPPPPPPPPPLPPGSYHSVRGEFFARPQLRKTASMDSSKTN